MNRPDEKLVSSNKQKLLSVIHEERQIFIITAIVLVVLYYIMPPHQNCVRDAKVGGDRLAMVYCPNLLVALPLQFHPARKLHLPN